MTQQLRGRNVFVSGGAGVIGRELVPLLIEYGANVMVGDLKSRPHEWPSSVLYRQGDLNDITVTELVSFEPEIFIHLAATFERTTESLDFWEQNFHHNVALSHNLMTQMQALDSLRRVVFASSYLVYDPSLYLFDSSQAKAVKLSETSPIRPRNLTGMAKLSHELELEFLSSFESTSFSTVSARIFRGYGQGSRCVVSRWVRALLAGEAIHVYREEGIFDYVFARDSAEGLARIAAADSCPRIINIGTGIGTSVADVVGLLQTRFPGAEVLRQESAIEHEASSADTSLLDTTLSWIPSISLASGIDRIIEYERQTTSYEQGDVGGVLITSASGKIPLLRSLEASIAEGSAEGFVVAGDVNPRALVAFTTGRFWCMPRLDEVPLDTVVAELIDQRIQFVIPTRDGELEYFSTNRQAFLNRGIHVMISPTTAIHACGDKLRFASFCEEHGLPSIPTVENSDALSTGVERFVVKERFGAGSASMGLCLGAEDVAEWVSKLDSPIIQPYVEGVEFSVDAYRCFNTECVRTIVRSRDVVINGESKVTTIVHDEEISELAERFLNALGIRGHAVVQVLRSAEGPQIVECNPRIGGASTLAFAAGLRSVDWFIRESFGDKLDARSFHSPAPLRLVRISKDTFQ
jgi:carbamoyl-phosphate synthase large subunit